jgi:cytochrome P450
MSALTLRIISKTMFSTESPEVIDLIARTMADGFAVQNFNLLDVMPIIGPMRMNARMQRMAALFRPMDDVVFAMIKDRQAGRGNGDDLVGRLVAARDEEGGPGLTPEEVRDEVITIYIAGHETTAVAMSWIWYLLAQHPHVVAKLEDELDRVLAGRTPRQEDIEKLVYTRRIADEAMRLYPPAPGISARACLADDEVAGERIKRGSYVNVLPWVLHRHRDLWDEPERFDPDRWEKPLKHRFAYMPFGAGPRICIGQLMAVNEIVLILAGLAQRFRVRLAPGANVAMRANITLRPLGLTMLVERR